MSAPQPKTPHQKRYYIILTIFVIIVLILIPLWYSIDFDKDAEENTNVNPVEHIQPDATNLELK